MVKPMQHVNVRKRQRTISMMARGRVRNPRPHKGSLYVTDSMFVNGLTIVNMLPPIYHRLLRNRYKHDLDWGPRKFRYGLQRLRWFNQRRKGIEND